MPWRVWGPGGLAIERTGGGNRAFMAERLLEVRGLKTVFPTKDGVVKAVDGVDFHLDPGETLGIVGDSGCGKSTTARLLVPLLQPTSGQICFEGQDITGAKGAALKALRREMQMIFEDRSSSLNRRKSIGSIRAELLPKVKILGRSGRAARPRAGVQTPAAAPRPTRSALP